MDKYSEFLQEISNKNKALSTHAHKYGQQYHDLLELNKEMSSKKEKISKKIDDLLSIKKVVENPESSRMEIRKEFKGKIKKRAKVNGLATAALGIVLVICTAIVFFTPNFSLANVGLASLAVVSHFILNFSIDLISGIIAYNKKVKNQRKIINDNDLEEVIVLIEVLQKSANEYEEILKQNHEQLMCLNDKIWELEEKIISCYSTIKVVNEAREVAIQEVESPKTYESLINEEYAKKYCTAKIHPNLSRILTPQKKSNRKGVKHG